MSTAGSTQGVRQLIARSNRLYLDTNTLQYFTGFLKTEPVAAAAVKKLLQQNELETLGADSAGIVSMRLTADSYHETVTQRTVRDAQRTHWQLVTPMFTSGVPSADSDPHLIQAQPLLGVKATNSVLRRLITATAGALDAFRANPDLPGQSVPLPACLFAIEAKEYLHSGEHVQPSDNVQVTLFINAANGQYTVGMPWNGLWVGTVTIAMKKLLAQMTQHPIGTLSKSTLKAGYRLSRDPLVTERIRHPDEEDAAVFKSIGSRGPAESDEQIS